jgi:NADH-quinone oxidoreductase subunit A
MNSPIAVAGYLALFIGLGFLFLFGNLLLGWLLRPKLPNQQKLEVYECGEPTIGSSFVQFDLRFYVVALLFIIFDVEVAFFFPWATVYGKATHLMDPNLAKVQATANELTAPATELYRELGVARPSLPAVSGDVTPAQAIEETARQLAMLSLFDIGVFFAVLLVGFAYVWKRGDLDWVRAISRDRSQPAQPSPSDSEMALSA